MRIDVAAVRHDHLLVRVHAYDAHDRGTSKLKILELGWHDGWPTLDVNALGRQPQESP